jgi:hypothetical protein
MLLQAVQDAMSISTGRRSGAIRWMSSRDESAFSFLFVCRVVNRDPNEVRHFCKLRMAQRQMPALMYPGVYQQHQQTYSAGAA